MSKEFNGIQRPAVYRHANPDLAFLDSNNVAGGFRTKLDTLQELYNDGTPRPAIPEASIGKFKDHSTLVYVEETQKYYVLVDYNNSHNANGWEVFVGDVEDTDVTYDNVWLSGQTSGTTLEEWYNVTQSAGRFSGGTITDGGSGTVDVAAGSGLIKDTDSDTGVNRYVEWDAVSNLSLSEGYNYVFYNATAGQIQATTTEANIIRNDNFNLGRVFRQGSSVLIRLCGQNLWNLNRRLHRVGDELFGVQRAEGLVTTVATQRQFNVSGGVLWAELLNRFETDDFTAGNDFTFWYFDGSEWQSGTINEISDDWDDGGSTPVTASAGEYTVHWVYVVHDSSVHVVLHDEVFTGITEARLATPRATLPPLVAGYATLSARIIVQEGDSDIVEIGSAFDQVFATTTPVQHNDLGGIQGGAVGEYNHLTNDQVIDVEKIPSIEAITDVALTGATNGLTKVGNHDVELGGALTESTTIEIVSGTSLFIEDSRTDTRGIKYVDDYSTFFTERSLVDKGYVDSIASGLVPVNAVDVATTDDETDLVFTNLGHPTIDGVVTAEGMRVLVKNQINNPEENGIYVVSGSTDTWVRAEDYDGTPEGEVQQGNIIPVISGDTQFNQLWVLVTENPIDVGTTELTFARFSKPIDILGGDGIDIDQVGGQKTISVDLFTNGGLTFDGSVNQLRIDEDIAGNGLDWTTGVLSIDLDADSGLLVGVDGLTIDSNIAGDGLTWTAGVLSVDPIDVGITGSTNGLTDDGSTVELGGELTDDTTIDGNFLHEFNILNAESIIIRSGTDENNPSNGSKLELGGSALSIDNGYGFNLFGSNASICQVSIYYDGSEEGYPIIRNDITTGFPATSTGGIRYFADYSDGFVARSLPDVAYVTGLTDALQTQINNIDTGLTGSTNGLTDDGSTVKLGGELTENTEISGNTSTEFKVDTGQIRFVSTSTANNSGIRLLDEGGGSIMISGNSGGVNIRDTGGGIYIEDSGGGGFYVDSNGGIYIEETGFGIFLTSDEVGITSAEVKLNITPPAITTEAFSVLVRDDSSGEVKTVDGSELGEDNNNYNTYVSSTSFTATTEMYVILLDTSFEEITITLPASPVDGQAYRIKDSSGNALTNNVTINGNGETIDGGSTALINTDYGAIEIVWRDGLGWFILSFVN